jgi:hypothetical protein
VLGDFDALEVDQAFARFDRARIAPRGRRLGCAGPDRVLSMKGRDKAVRTILTLLCMVAFVWMTMTALAHILRLEVRAGLLTCQKAVTRALRRSPSAGTDRPTIG